MPSDEFATPRIDRVSFANIQHASRQAFERMQSDFDEQRETSAITLQSVGGVSVSLSAGYLMWLLRSGSLLSALMATMPVWRGFDPLFVLARTKEDGVEAANADSDSVQKIFDAGTPAHTAET